MGRDHHHRIQRVSPPNAHLSERENKALLRIIKGTMVCGLTLSLCFQSLFFHSPYLLSLEVIMLREVRQSRASLFQVWLSPPRDKSNSWRLKRGENAGNPVQNKTPKNSTWNQNKHMENTGFLHTTQSSSPPTCSCKQRCVYPPRSCELFHIKHCSPKILGHMCATRRHSPYWRYECLGMAVDAMKFSVFSC